MSLIFTDETFGFELLRTIGHAVAGAADIGECLAAAGRMTDGDVESWHREWLALADRVNREAETSAAGGHDVSARGGFLRASNYYRAAEFFLHADPADPRILSTWRASRDAFGRAVPLLPHPAVAAVARGYVCLTFTGPGQGEAIREQGLPFRPDWEAVVTPVVDFALDLPRVDPDRMALLGWSLGGLLAARAAAFEPRLAALITWDGVYDNFAAARPMLPPHVADKADELFARDPRALDDYFIQAMAANLGPRWAFTQGMWAFGKESPGEVIAAGRDYHLRGIAGQIRCPTLVCAADADPFWQGQPEQLYGVLSCPKTFICFTATEGAGHHCHVGAHSLFHQRAFDWLDLEFGVVSRE